MLITYYCLRKLRNNGSIERIGKKIASNIIAIIPQIWIQRAGGMNLVWVLGESDLVSDF